jgi:TPR repeat protein
VVPKDYAQAERHYRRAAETGFSAAQNNLGMLYLRGEGVPQDHARAAEWFARAARQGAAEAAYNLAALYEYGRGVEPSHVRAVELFKQAALQGHVAAAEWLFKNGYTAWVERIRAERGERASTH